MKKVLFVANVVRLHINLFHQPYIKWFHDNGWQVDVAAANDYDNPNDCIIPYCDHYYDIPVERSPFKKGNIQAIKQLKTLMKKEKYDIVHCHTPIGSVVARLAVGDARKHGTKVIYTAHGFHFYKNSPISNWLVFYPVEWLMSFRTDLLITMNHEDYRLAKHLHAKKIAFVNGVGFDTQKYISISDERKSEIRKELGIPEDAFLAITIGQTVYRKNHLTQIRAIAQLNNPDIHLVICGDGEQFEEWRSEIHKLKMDKQIHLMGFCPNARQYLPAADAFLFSSVREGLPVSVMEAMASGLPIVTSNIRGNTDLIKNEEGGYLLDPFDVGGYAEKINYIYENKYIRESMRDVNLRTIRKYDLSHVYKQMSKLYMSVIKD